MMKTLLSTLIVCAIGFKSFALTYTSINDGNYNDITNVWSTNGSTPCNCSPNAIINNDTVIIQNSINTTSHITLNNNNALLKILPGGILNNINFKLIIKKGKVISNGTIETKELNIEATGRIELFSSVLNIQSRILCEGTFISEFSNIYIALGNIDVGVNGSFTIGTNSKIYFITGNFENYGYVSICGDCCLHLTAGNIQNNAGGVFDGQGSTITDNGNIKNLNNWNSSLRWCAAGSSTGMPSPENCTDAIANCSFAPLPTELVSFNIISQEKTNLVSWYTFSERNGDYYTLERSKDGNQWEVLSTFDVQNQMNPEMHYLYLDDQPLPGISYYKLTLTSIDGEEVFSATLGVNSTDLDDVTIFPNPTTDHITVKFSNPLSWVKILVTDQTGQVVETFEGTDVLQETIHLPYPCGMYFVYISSESINETMKVIKK